MRVGVTNIKDSETRKADKKTRIHDVYIFNRYSYDEAIKRRAKEEKANIKRKYK
jgi:hypothetical protein